MQPVQQRCRHRDHRRPRIAGADRRCRTCCAASCNCPATTSASINTSRTVRWSPWASWRGGARHRSPDRNVRGLGYPDVLGSISHGMYAPAGDSLAMIVQTLNTVVRQRPEGSDGLSAHGLVGGTSEGGAPKTLLGVIEEERVQWGRVDQGAEPEHRALRPPLNSCRASPSSRERCG